MTKEIPDAQKTIEDSEKCANNVALLQFEAEIWNALKYKGTERGELLHGAHKQILEAEGDPSEAVEAYWVLVQTALRKQS